MKRLLQQTASKVKTHKAVSISFIVVMACVRYDITSSRLNSGKKKKRRGVEMGFTCMQMMKPSAYHHHHRPSLRPVRWASIVARHSKKIRTWLNISMSIIFYNVNQVHQAKPSSITTEDITPNPKKKKRNKHQRSFVHTSNVIWIADGNVPLTHSTRPPLLAPWRFPIYLAVLWRRLICFYRLQHPSSCRQEWW